MLNPLVRFREGAVAPNPPVTVSSAQVPVAPLFPEGAHGSFVQLVTDWPSVKVFTVPLELCPPLDEAREEGCGLQHRRWSERSVQRHARVGTPRSSLLPLIEYPDDFLGACFIDHCDVSSFGGFPR